MHISSKKLPAGTSELINRQFAMVLSELKNTKEAHEFSKDFFTEAEKIVLTKRLAIAAMLKQKKSYEEIKALLHVSSATISYVSEMLSKPGFQVALSKVDEDEWAENTLRKILPFLKK